MENNLPSASNVTDTSFFQLYSLFIFSLYNQDIPTFSPEPKSSYDFIIVGGGAAGCVIASRLSEIKNWNILLLEAGGEEPEVAKAPSLYIYGTGSKLNWPVKLEVHVDAKNEQPTFVTTSYPSGKVLGGSTTINGMLYLRGNRHIFDNWAKLGNKGWSYEDILKYFKKSEDNLNPQFARDHIYHGTKGPTAVQHYPYQDINTRAILEAMAELGYSEIDLNGKSQDGFMLGQGTVKDGIRQSAYTSFIKPYRYRRKNLDIITKAHVIKVLIDDSKKAYGVEYVTDDGVKVTVNATNEVILSAGFIRSPQILQLSGIGPRRILNDLGINVVQDSSVGENFRDHITATINVKLTKTATMPKSLWQLLSDYIDFLKFHRRTLSSTTVSQPAILSHSQHNTDPLIPDLQHIFASDQDVLPLDYYNAMLLFVFLVQNRSRGTLRIVSNDPLELPILKFYVVNDDIEPLIDGLEIAYELLETSAIKNLNASVVPESSCSQFEYKSRDYLRCVVFSTISLGSHGVGTCKMGPPSDPYAVVNERLKVYNITGLRVADASIMPTPINTNTQAATGMVGEKAADLIKEDWNVL